MPSDSALEQKFYRYEADFNKLVQMSKEDEHAHQIAFDFTHPEGVLPADRWDEYRRLFRKLGIKGGLGRWEDDKVDLVLIVSASGMATAATSKGYAYSTQDLSPIYRSLDHIHAHKLNSAQPAFRKLKDNWYLYYMFTD